MTTEDLYIYSFELLKDEFIRSGVYNFEELIHLDLN